ncbi:hypothetical protein ACF0H5_023347 [Mactra antiquata]
MKSALLVLTLVGLQLSVVFGALMVDHAKYNPEDRNTMYCEYKGVKFLPKSNFILYESCMKCTCSHGNNPGLHCATLPTAARVTVPDGSMCISVIVGCKNRWVYRDNPNKRCPKKHRPQQVSAVGK